MGYALTDNFSGGVDRSRPRYAGTAGTLWSGINGHLTRGGDFEKRKAFDRYATLPAGLTVGLAKTSAGLFTFGSGAAPAMPAGVSYQQLAHPTDPTRTLTKLQSWDLFAGQIYAIGKFDNNDIRHYYNGVNVADWNAGGTKPNGWGSIVRTHKRKVYSPITSLLWFGKLDTGNVFDTTQSGSGFNNMSTHLSGSDTVTALGVFQNLLAVFSRRVIQIWSMQDDNALNTPTQFLEETGTRSPRSVRGFGDLDAFYLSDSGIRSLRSRTVSNVAGVNDVGTPIDSVVREWLGTLTDQQIIDAVAVVDPVDGRFWLAVGGRVFVFSYFPSKKVSGWTWYEPGVDFTDLVNVNDRVYARAGDQIYLYGGAGNNVYDNSRVTVELPYLAGGRPGTYKQIKGFDIAASGTWDVKILVDPRDETQYLDVGEISGHTFVEPNIAVDGHTTMFAPVMVNEAAGYASISQFAIHNDGAESK